MNILLGTLVFNGYTGSEWYCYELARGLASMTNEKGKPLNKITIFSNTHPETALTGNLRKLGVKFINAGKPHHIPADFDIVHFAHKPIGEYLLKQKTLKKAKFLTTIHSEIISLEHPIIDERIKKYITIRDSISNMVIDGFGVDSSLVQLIGNPIDTTRFNTENTCDEGYILFHGSLDYLRKESALHCIEFAKEKGLKVIFVGRNDLPEFNNKNMPTCIFEPAAKDLSSAVKSCTMTAGILLGRSTIEGYFCGKRGLIYDVDSAGKILAVDDTFIETEECYGRYDSEKVVGCIFEVYKSL